MNFPVFSVILIYRPLTKPQKTRNKFRLLRKTFVETINQRLNYPNVETLHNLYFSEEEYRTVYKTSVISTDIFNSVEVNSSARVQAEEQS